MYQSKIQSEETDRLFEAMLSLKSVEEFYQFFDDLCTIGEIRAMTQRLQVAQMLRNNVTFAQIYEQTGVSSGTITRVNRCLSYGAGGYELALERLAPRDVPSASDESVSPATR